MELQLLVFDTRRGNKEGEEDDKVLAGFPSGQPLPQQCGVAGLLQGLLLFTANFTAALRPCWDVAETESGTWVLLEPEPHIWFAALAPRAWLPRHTTEQTLRALLHQLHLLTTVLCGSVQGMLDQDHRGILARAALQAVLEHVGRQLGSPASWQHRELRNPLGDAALPQLLQLSPGAALAVQGLSNHLLLAKLHGRQAVQGVVLLYGPHLLSSSLAPDDTAALFALLGTGLLHASSSSGGGKAFANGSSNGDGNGCGAAHAAAAAQAPPGLRALDGGSWLQLPSGFLVQRGGTEAAAGQEPAGAVLRVHLRHSADGCEAGHGGPGTCHLLPLLDSRLLVAALLRSDAPLTPQLLAGLHGLVAGPARHLATQLGEEARGGRAEAAHVPGFRYLLRDGCQLAARASPRVKVSAMTHHARTLAAALRDSLHRPPVARGAAGEGGREAGEGLGATQGLAGRADGGADADAGSAQVVAGRGSDDGQALEVVARSSQDCWAYAARAAGGRQLLAVRERRTERDLPEAAAVLQGFADDMFAL